MRLNSIQNFTLKNTSSFTSKRSNDKTKTPHRPAYTYVPLGNLNSEPSGLTESQKKAIRTIASVFTAGAIFGAGFAVGNSVGTKNAKINGFNEGYENGYEYGKKIAGMLHEPSSTEAAEATTTPFLVEESESNNYGDIIPQSVNTLSEGRDVREENPIEKSFISEYPNYLKRNKISRKDIATAQSNLARLFVTTDNKYIILSPKKDTTIGELKSVFGIVDGALSDEKANKLEEKEKVSGSDNNLDNAIVKANEAVRVLRYDQTKGHTVGRYSFHKSQKSHEKIIDAIINNMN